MMYLADGDRYLVFASKAIAIEAQARVEVWHRDLDRIYLLQQGRHWHALSLPAVSPAGAARTSIQRSAERRRQRQKRKSVSAWCVVNHRS
jgi:hypothetical protein